LCSEYVTIQVGTEGQRHKGTKVQMHKENMNLYYLNRDEFDKLYELSQEIERMLSSLIRKLSSNRQDNFVPLCLCAY
ncbi:MAG: hypothetical protein KKC73_02155, partial [Proteobacteria bacterium]|nr:hypothetical protein [Pseudomonadota bacterium]